MRRNKVIVNGNRKIRSSEEEEQIRFQRKVIREENVSNEWINKRAKGLKIY